MPKGQIIKNSFIKGEISPYLLARTDLEQYNSACEMVHNYIVRYTGGANRRFGTSFIAPALGPSRLIPFVISATESYVLEFGNQILRFYTKHAQVTTAPGSGIPYQIATPFNTATDDLWGIQYAQVGSVLYMTHPNHPPQKLIREAETSWFMVQPGFYGPPTTQQDIDYSQGTISIALSNTQVGVGGAVASAPVFLAGDIGRGVIAGTGIGWITDVGGTTATDPNTGGLLYNTAALNIVDSYDTNTYPAGQWKLRGGPLAFFSAGTFNVNNSEWKGGRVFSFGKTIPVRTTTDYPVDNSWYAVTGTTSAPVQYLEGFTDSFRMQDLNSYVPFADGYGQITAITDSTSCNILILQIPSQTITNAWGVPLIAPTPPGGWWFELPEFVPGNYPTCITVSQDRVWFASTPNNPQTFWGSGTGDYENFALGTLATSPLRATLNSGTLDQMIWMITYQGNLVMGTYQSEYIVNGGAGQEVISAGSPITPTNINMIQQSRFGTINVTPLLVNNELLFVQRQGNLVYEFAFNPLTSAYSSRNMNLYNEVVTTGTFKEMYYQATPFKIVWLTDSNGFLVGLTYDKSQDVWAWHRQYTGTDTNDSFVSICVIPDVNAEVSAFDDFYCVTQRTINGAVAYYVEYMTDENALVDCCSHTIFPSPVTSIGNLQYLEGRPVYVVLGGNQFLFAGIMGPNGTFAFPPGVSATDVQAGLNFTSEILTVRPEPRPTVQGLIKRWTKVWTRVYETLGITVNGQEIPFMISSTPMGEGTPLITGDIQIVNLGFDRDGRIDVQQTNPLPSIILGIFGMFEISDGI
jgi:hypothetical protein